ncbi:spc97 spc98 family protein [Cystoisospora suis]|uniref:Spc97 spc98 family protein n=1 Tax=Cystoisospora suis TaxID=483139 RepID=A0A2C6L9E7_9APIC|nr:spc97 spc98 family protein [Cystoisospora suis]
MMHEMLMALAGFPGDVFIYRRPVPPEDELISSLPPPSLAFSSCSSFSKHGRTSSPLAQHRQSNTLPNSEGISYSPDENSKRPAEGGLFLNPDLGSFFTSSEKDLLNKIVAAGYHYLEVQEFISSVDFTACRPPPSTTAAGSTLFSQQIPNDDMDEKRRRFLAEEPESLSGYQKTRFVGLYVSSLARAMDEMLRKYLQAVVEIEAQVLQQPLLPLTAVYVLLAAEQQKLRTLHEVVTKYRAMAGLHTSLSSSSIMGDLFSSSSSSVSASSSSSSSRAPDINGLRQQRQERILLLPCGPLLDMLWEGTRSGSPVVQQVYRQLVDACAHVFIFQLSSWLLSGQLLDPYGEFFLARRVCPFLTFSSFSSSSSRFFDSSPGPSFFCSPSTATLAKSEPKYRGKKRHEDREKHHLSLSTSSSTSPGPVSFHKTSFSASPVFFPPSSSVASFSSRSSLFASGNSFLYEDLAQPLSPQCLCYEWEHMFSISLSKLPVCCFPHAKAPLFPSPLVVGGKPSSLLSSSSLSVLTSSSFSTSNSWEIATAATTAAFVGKTVRVLTRSGRWGEHHTQQLRPIIAKMRRAFRHPCSPATVLLPCLEILRRVAGNLLWEMIVEEAALQQQMILLKDFFLLGNGEKASSVSFAAVEYHFYQLFLETATKCTRRHASFLSSLNFFSSPSSSTPQTRLTMTFELQLRRSFQKATVDGAMISVSSSSPTFLSSKISQHLLSSREKNLPHSAGSSRSTAASPTAGVTTSRSTSEDDEEELEEDEAGVREGEDREGGEEEKEEDRTRGRREEQEERKEKTEVEEIRPAGLPTPTNTRMMTSAYSTPRCSSSPPVSRSHPSGFTPRNLTQNEKRESSERRSPQHELSYPRERTSTSPRVNTSSFSSLSPSSSSSSSRAVVARYSKNHLEKEEEEGRLSRSYSLVSLRPPSRRDRLRLSTSAEGRRDAERKEKKNTRERRRNKAKDFHSSSMSMSDLILQRSARPRLGWTSADAQRAFQIRVIGRGFLIHDFCQLERRTFFRRSRSRIGGGGGEEEEDEEGNLSTSSASASGLSRISRPECILRGQARIVTDGSLLLGRIEEKKFGEGQEGKGEQATGGEREECPLGACLHAEKQLISHGFKVRRKKKIFLTEDSCEPKCKLKIGVAGKQLISHGFKHSVLFSLQPPPSSSSVLSPLGEDSSSPSYSQKEEKENMRPPWGAALAVVFQNGRPPASFKPTRGILWNTTDRENGKVAGGGRERKSQDVCCSSSCDLYWPSIGDCVAVEVRVGRYSKRQFQALERSRHQFEKQSMLSRKERRSQDDTRDEEEAERPDRDDDDDDDESLSFDEETVIVAEASLLVGKKARSMRGRKAMPSGLDQSQSLDSISSLASPFTLFSPFSSSAQDTLHMQRPLSSSVRQPISSSQTTSRGGSKNAGLNSSFHPTSQGLVFPGGGVCTPQAILVNRGYKQWTLPTCEDLDDETFTLTIRYLPERQELRVDLQYQNSDDVVVQEDKIKNHYSKPTSRFQPSLRQSPFSSTASLLRVLGFDLLHALTMEQGAAYIGLFSLPLFHCHHHRLSSPIPASSSLSSTQYAGSLSLDMSRWHQTLRGRGNAANEHGEGSFCLCCCCCCGKNDAGAEGKKLNSSTRREGYGEGHEEEEERRRQFFFHEYHLVKMCKSSDSQYTSFLTHICSFLHACESMLFSLFSSVIQIQEWIHQSYPTPLQPPPTSTSFLTKKREGGSLFHEEKEDFLSSGMGDEEELSLGRRDLREEEGNSHLLLQVQEEELRRGGLLLKQQELWRRVQLVFSPVWPLPLLISSRNIDCYNAIFHLLFQMKHCYFELQRLWLDAIFVCKRRASYLKNSTVRRRLPTPRFRGRSRTPPRCSQESRDINRESEKEEIERKKREDEEEAQCWAGEELWILRARMQFAVGRILHHLLSAVIEPAFHQLQEVVRKSGDFERVKMAHESFLLHLASKCWLRLSSLLRPLLHALDCIRKFIEVFTNLLERYRSTTTTSLIAIHHLRSQQSKQLSYSSSKKSSSISPRFNRDMSRTPTLDLSQALLSPSSSCLGAVEASASSSSPLSPQEWAVLRVKLHAIRDELDRHLCVFAGELEALRQNPLHAQLDLLMTEFNFNSFFSRSSSSRKKNSELSPPPTPSLGPSSRSPRNLSSSPPSLPPPTPLVTSTASPRSSSSTQGNFTSLLPSIVPSRGPSELAAKAASLLPQTPRHGIYNNKSNDMIKYRQNSSSSGSTPPRSSTPKLQHVQTPRRPTSLMESFRHEEKTGEIEFASASARVFPEELSSSSSSFVSSKRLPRVSTPRHQEGRKKRGEGQRGRGGGGEGPEIFRLDDEDSSPRDEDADEAQKRQEEVFCSYSIDQSFLLERQQQEEELLQQGQGRTEEDERIRRGEMRGRTRTEISQQSNSSFYQIDNHYGLSSLHSSSGEKNDRLSSFERREQHSYPVPSPSSSSVLPPPSSPQIVKPPLPSPTFLLQNASSLEPSLSSSSSREAVLTHPPNPPPVFYQQTSWHASPEEEEAKGKEERDLYQSMMKMRQQPEELFGRNPPHLYQSSLADTYRQQEGVSNPLIHPFSSSSFSAMASFSSSSSSYLPMQNHTSISGGTRSHDVMNIQRGGEPVRRREQETTSSYNHSTSLHVSSSSLSHHDIPIHSREETKSSVSADLLLIRPPPLVPPQNHLPGLFNPNIQPSQVTAMTHAGGGEEEGEQGQERRQDDFYTDLQARARAALQEARERAARRNLLE